MHFILKRDEQYLFLELNQLEQITAGAIFKDDPKMVTCLIPIKELEYMPIFEVVEYANLY